MGFSPLNLERLREVPIIITYPSSRPCCNTVNELSSIVMSDIKLTDLTPSIFSALLTKLNVKTPKAESRPKEKNQHWRNCYKALQNSLLYMNLFEGVEPDQVIVSHEEGTILNVTSKTDDALISLFSLDYPCVCCHTPVDDDDDRSGNSLRCSVCRLYWHNECGGPDYLISPELVKALKNAPPNVSIHCPKCMELEYRLEITADPPIS